MIILREKGEPSCFRNIWHKLYDLETEIDDFIEELHIGIHPIAHIIVGEDTDVGMHTFGGVVTYEWLMENLWNIYSCLDFIRFEFRDTEDFINIYVDKTIVFSTYEESLGLHEFLGIEQDTPVLKMPETANAIPSKDTARSCLLRRFFFWKR
ncbi:MAG: hypothetical protein IJO09_09890 [Oscillospiraceae bacterium]|nr:hypothetical protein [Oscillospiraceae bacterium]